MGNDYQEIDLRELIRVILRNWWLIALLLIISASASYVATANYMEPVYVASTSLFIGKEHNQIGGISIGDLQLNNQLINDYRQLTRSRMVAEEVIEQLDVNMTIGTLRGNLSVNTIKDSRLFTINFYHTNPQLAADVVNQVANVLVLKAAEIVDVENIQVIDTALVPQIPVKPSIRNNVVIAGILGIMVAIFIILLLEFLNNTIKTEEDVEKHLGLTVLGVIPKFKGRGRKYAK